ncbi:hypothetical protein [Radiobacillus sp. PE A8.2]|uniref:hypothetical protein n=1 Tax=Radiobacillus sp. PE A8.2 TaxID=3380349 RepID=UPI00388E2816
MPNSDSPSNSNQIKIGIIGSKPLLKEVELTLQYFPSFKPFFLEHNDEFNISDEVKEALNEVEIILFTEYHIYERVKDSLDTTVPTQYIPLIGTGLYRALFRMSYLLNVNQFTIDSVSRNYVEQIINELEVSNVNINYFNNHPYTTHKELIDFHSHAYNNGTSLGALTGVQSVSQTLTERNVPNIWVTPTNQDITVSLERALLSTETRRNKESQIVVGLIDIDEFRRVVEKFPSEHEIQKMKLDIHGMLLDYVKQLDGHLSSIGGGEYLFITTRGIFERETRGYKFIPLLEDENKTPGISLSIGVGFGRTATDAGTHARLALRQSKDAGGNICYIVREDKSVLGPVEMSNAVTYELSVTDKELLEKAEKAGMSATYMTKLLAQVKRYDKTDYTAFELASVLGITIRSAHRILAHWVDANIVDIIGEEKHSSKGRPRQIYRLNL